MGTCFDIKAYLSDEVVSVDVESGKVKVDLPEAMMRLSAQERVYINTSSGEYNKQHEKRTVAVLSLIHIYDDFPGLDMDGFGLPGTRQV